jgi:hypothetical protein
MAGVGASVRPNRSGLRSPWHHSPFNAARARFSPSCDNAAPISHRQWMSGLRAAAIAGSGGTAGRDAVVNEYHRMALTRRPIVAALGLARLAGR